MTTFTFQGVSTNSTTPIATLTIVTSAADSVFSYTGAGGTGGPVTFDYSNAYDVTLEYNGTLYTFEEVVASNFYMFETQWANGPTTIAGIRIGGNDIAFSISGTFLNDFALSSAETSAGGIFAPDTDFTFAQSDYSSITENDVIEGSNQSEVYETTLGDDTINSRGGDDTIIGGDGDDVVNSGRGNDRIEGGADQDLLRGGQGNDFIYGGDGLDRMIGGSDNDLLHGGDDKDVMYGGSGNDDVVGQDGNDRLFGGDGGDHMNGGKGNDVLAGGIGAGDIFYFYLNDGSDRILDFETGLDRIRFVGTGLEFDDLDISGRGTDTVIRYGDSRIVLKDVDVDDIMPEDFGF